MSPMRLNPGRRPIVPVDKSSTEPATPPIPLSDQERAGSDEAACDEKMRNWYPTGILARLGIVQTIDQPDPDDVRISAPAGSWADIRTGPDDA